VEFVRGSFCALKVFDLLVLEVEMNRINSMGRRVLMYITVASDCDSHPF
jgi:hypothetical protein